MATAPSLRPKNPHFSTGPTSKHPGWSLASLQSALLGRSHRAKEPKARLKQAIDLTHEVLQIPADYRVAIVPGSDTGAVEMALWSLLGARGVDVLAWEAFGERWALDICNELKLKDVRALRADYGEIADLASVNFDHDVVFTWNGTSAGVCVPNGDWIAGDRAGLTICDATSAAFAQRLDWQKLDVVTFSWQKVLGGEGAHGMLVLSPRAVARLESYNPPWPVPKLFRLAEDGKLIESIFQGETINTPSLLCVEDYIDALQWAQSLGGLEATIDRVSGNAQVLIDWVRQTSWIDFLARDAATRSPTSVCLSIVDPAVMRLPVSEQAAFVKRIVERLEKEGVALDIGSYRDAPPGLRIWCGATIEKSDLEALVPWLDYVFQEVVQTLAKAA